MQKNKKPNAKASNKSREVREGERILREHIANPSRDTLLD